jgi:hypothetical protein
MYTAYDPLKDAIYDAAATVARGAEKIDEGTPHL